MTKPNYSEWTAEDFRNELVALGATEEEVKKVKSKAKLQKMLEDIPSVSDDDSLEQEYVESDSNHLPDEVETHLAAPSMNDPGWTEYLMSLLTEEEVYTDKSGAKRPKVHGLRRLMDRFVGSYCGVAHSAQAPNANNGYIATVEYSLYLDDGRVVSAVADASREQFSNAMRYHLSSIAATLAEAIACRKVLRMNIHSAEEVGLETSGSYDDGLDRSKFASIDFLAEQNDVNVIKTMATIGIEKLVSDDDTQKVLEELNRLRSVGVPVELKGYQQGWAS